RCGPAASSAALIADIAISSGSAATTAGSCQSMITDVSRRPEVTSESLVDHPVEVGAEMTVVDADPGSRQCRDFVAGDECAATKRDEPTRTSVWRPSLPPRSV